MGAWIEIVHVSLDGIEVFCRTPRWVRGLKLLKISKFKLRILSHPTMGAWIEIVSIVMEFVVLKVAPHDGCVD